MAKQRKPFVSSVVDYTVSSEPLVIETEPVYNEPEQMVSVRSRFPAQLKYTGLVTGKRYEWMKSGDVVVVSAVDAPSLLSKILGGSPCCGGATRNVMFELV